MDLLLILGAAIVFGGIWFAANNPKCDRCQDEGFDEDGEPCFCRWKDYE